MELNKKGKGDLAELRVATDLRSRGYKVAFPYGEDWDYDLVLCREDRSLERVQVKYACSDGRVIIIRCDSQSLTNGRVKKTKLYTAEIIDWLAVWDRTVDRCFYVPAAELGPGMNRMSPEARPHAKPPSARHQGRRALHGDLTAYHCLTGP